MASSLEEPEVAQATLDILRSADLNQLTLRKVMHLLSEHFDMEINSFAPWKRFVKEQINTYLTAMSRQEDESPEVEEKPKKSSGPRKEIKLKGLMKAVVLAQPLADLLGKVVLPRTHISKRISEYVKKHDLQNPENKREILCDEKLRKVFGVDKFTYFTLNKHISHLVYKPQDCSPELQQLAAKCEKELLEEMREQAQEDHANGIDPSDKKSKKRKRPPALDEDGNPKPKKLNGLSKPMQLDDDLAEVCGSNVLSRSEVVKQIWNYIKSNNLQDPKDKRQIITDDKLKKIFNGEERVSGFGLSKFLGAHLSLYEGEVDETGAAILPQD